MNCTICGSEIERKQIYLAVFKNGNGFRVEEGTTKLTPESLANEGEILLAVVGSFVCLHRWLEAYEEALILLENEFNGRVQ